MKIRPTTQIRLVAAGPEVFVTFGSLPTVLKRPSRNAMKISDTFTICPLSDRNACGCKICSCRTPKRTRIYPTRMSTLKICCGCTCESKNIVKNITPVGRIPSTDITEWDFCLASICSRNIGAR
uniref:(northern house mosquito) hypothetical protein n=1 Tax=Culex pipiens TaxID=7175 RepID=A0A8D8A3Z1_CULPI